MLELKEFKDVDGNAIELFHKQEKTVRITVREKGTGDPVDIADFKGAKCTIKEMPDSKTSLGAWVGIVLDDGTVKKRGRCEVVLSMKTKDLTKAMRGVPLLVAFLELTLIDKDGLDYAPTHYPIKIYAEEKKK